MLRRIAALCAISIFIWFTAPAAAATTGIVRGVVTLDGKPIAGARVTLVGEGSRFEKTTDADGAYAFANVPFGSYRLTGSASGVPDLALDINVASGTVSTVNVPLSHLKQIAAVSVNAQRGASGNPVAVTVVDRAQIQTSPVQNSLDRLIETLPGVVQFSYNEPVVNGFHGITYQIDGAPLPVATTSNFSEIVDPKNIDSLEVYSGSIPAEFGGDRMGAVVNIITKRPSDVPEGFYGQISGGVGTQSWGQGGLNMSGRAGSTEAFLTLNSQSTSRGIDAPTYVPIFDASSQNDQFFRVITQLNARDTLAFDYSNQFAQFQIPINTSTTNVNDPIVSVPGTADTQREYGRFANLNFIATSRDGNGVFQLVPWWTSARTDYDGDLARDVLGTQPNFGCPTFPACEAPYPDTLNSVGLQQNSQSQFVGLRVSDFRATKHHAWKVGVDVNRQIAQSSQIYACYYVACNVPGPQGDPSIPLVHEPPYYAAIPPAQDQAGSQTAVYAQDQWEPNPNIVFNYGIRYDHSTGYTHGWQISPRIGINVSDGGKNVAHVYYGKFYAAPLLQDVRDSCVVFAAQDACPTTRPVYDLQPESDTYVELGWSHSFNSHFILWANLFNKSVVNILDTTQFLNTPLFAVYNNAAGENTGFELRLQNKLPQGDNWFVTATISASYAGGISGSTFLFPPGVNPPGIPITSPSLWSLEDHSQDVDATAGYTHRFGGDRNLFATLQANYGSGFPVQFEDANVNLNGTLPAHTTFDLLLGRTLTPGPGNQDQGLGVQVGFLNLLDHQYVIKVANGFNTTQIANGRTITLRLLAPF